jgi:hypothetical protein
MMPEHEHKDDGRSWHLDKRVNVGHMLTTFGLFGALLVSLNDLQDQVLRNTSDFEHQREIIARVELVSAQRGNAIQAQLDRIDSKIDRLSDITLKRGSGN